MTTTFQIQNGDVLVDRSSGQPALVTGRAKLRQDVLNGLSMQQRADNIGAGLEEVIDGQAATPAFVEQSLRRGIRGMVDAIQALQARFQRGSRTRDEILVRLGGLNVSRVPSDPTAFYFKASFVAGDSSTVDLSGRVS